jgi:uncharacterized protein YwgA
MKTDRLILLILDHSGGTISGKTLLQKRCFFLARLLGEDLHYEAHYYGPYSVEVEEGLAKLKALGFVQERSLGFGVADRVGFEVRRYDYTLTEDGRTVVRALKKREPAECARVESVLDRLRAAGDTGNYVELSIAAKTFHILSETESSMTASTIRMAAKDLGWEISEKSIDEACGFLEKLNMVKKE